MASTPAPSELELVDAARARLLPHTGSARTVPGVTAVPGVAAGIDAGQGTSLADRLRAADFSRGQVEESGQFHRVLMLDDVAVLRMTRLHEAGAPPGSAWDPAGSPAAQLPRRMALVSGLARAGLPFAVPEPLSEVITVPDDAGHPLSAAVLQRFVPGTPHPPHEGDPAVLRGIVDALDTVDVAAPELAPHLGPAFAFRGPWTPERMGRVSRVEEFLPPEHAGPLVQALPGGEFPGVVERVAGTVTAWAAAPPDGPALVHGDLAGHNMHWLPELAPTAEDPAAVRWRLAGILDWDLAHAGDAARNVAYLGIWHGEHLIDEIARTPEEARRARVWLAAAALDSLDDARARQEITGRAPRWGKLLRRVTPRIARAAALL